MRCYCCLDGADLLAAHRYHQLWVLLVRTTAAQLQLPAGSFLLAETDQPQRSDHPCDILLQLLLLPLLIAEVITWRCRV
jgi:hypothetical protein